MKILTRHIFREFCVPLFYCFAGFTSIYILFELFGSFSRLAEARPGWGDTLAYFAGYFAPYFEWMAPACLMLATLYTMWSFCRHSEITAMRASGIGFFTIVKPLLFGALLTALAVTWVNEVYVPRRGQWAKQFRAAHFRAEEMDKANDIVFRNAKSDRTWKVGMLVTEDATVLEDVKISVDWPNGGGRRMTVNAPRAEYLDGIWFFDHPEVYHFDEHGAERPSPTPELEKLTLRTFPGFDEKPADFLLQNREWQFCSVRERLRFLDTHPLLTEATRRNYRYDVFAQIAAPFACLVITLFAIPAGIATGRQSVFRGIVTALALFFAFYGLTIGCMILAKRALLPPLAAALLPDIVFFAVGCRLFWKQR